MGVGNVYRHDYDNVEHDLVWRTVQERLPALLAAIEDEISIMESQELLPGAREPHETTPDELPLDIMPE